jgi:cyanophycin synthetase
MSSDHYWYGAHVAASAVQRALLRLRRAWKSEPAGQGLSPVEIFRLAAEPLGIEVRDLGCEAFELRHGDRVRRFQEMTCDLENGFALWVTGHKHMTFEMLRRAGISELPHYRVHSLASAEAARRDFRQRGRKVVVKPCFGTARGMGVTVGITTERELNRAIYTALCHDRQYLVEDFVEGDNYRLLVSSGRLIAALKRLPASVTGDGLRTIRELIERENARRSLRRGLTALSPIRLDADLERHLAAQGKSLRSVVGPAERISLRSLANVSLGGETEDVTPSVCTATVELCRRVTAELGVALAGIDIITRDIGRPLSETGGVINEVNTSPGLRLHYAARNGDPARDVARELLLDMFPSARPARDARGFQHGQGPVTMPS